MDGATTSGAAPGGVLRFVPQMWIEWVRFVRRPRLPAAREAFGGRAMAEVGQLLALVIAFDFALVVGLSWLSTKLGVKTPDFEELRKFGPVLTLLVGALALPIVEEIVFRGWLSGRRRMLVAVAVLVGFIASLAMARLTVGPAPFKTMAVLLLAWLVVGPVLIWKTKGSTPLWFARVFPVLYFASALLFGLAHISNYDMSRPWVLLPFVLPQATAGLIFGFARVRYGMWANIALHGLSNALFLGLTIAGM
ncbi:CPBP family glutamic-type intramembrane protease [Sphingomonas sp. RB1R13]|uniref:CPBP family glutamic-type intramembrane protease n=1 Tax=Sphingomonas sp. RB1R13 TaxID=3096159 RepID=UPI002FC955F7